MWPHFREASCRCVTFDPARLGSASEKSSHPPGDENGPSHIIKTCSSTNGKRAGVWQSLATFGRVRESLGELGSVKRVWESVGESGRIWENLGESGSIGENLRIWESLGESGRIWESLRERLHYARYARATAWARAGEELGKSWGRAGQELGKEL